MQSKQPSRPTLGRLEKIQPGDYWHHEDRDFLAWLSEADSIQLLSEATGLDLEVRSVVEEEDQPLGLVCCDRATNQPVLIEAQLDLTDASHLGQLITHAADLEISYLVWIASEFSPEHQTALTWLNQMTQGGTHIFGVTLGLWRIGKTAMAAEFDLVCQPEGWLTPAEAAETLSEPEAPEPEPPQEEPLTPLQQENLDFWTGLCERLDQRGSIVKAGAPTTEPRMGFAIARAGFRLYTTLDREHGCLYTELLLSGDDAHPHFHLLAAEQESIHEEFGLPLHWEAEEADPTCSIYVEYPEVNIADLEQWPTYYDWLCDRLERFYDVFSQRIKTIDAMDYQPLPDYSYNPLPNSLILP